MTEPQIRRASPEDAEWIIETHGALYQRDEGFDAGFQPLVARVVAAFMAEHDPDGERAWIVTQEGRRAGCLFCTRGSERVAKLRLFLLVPELRGQGIGRRLLTHSLCFAREAGYVRLQVSTYDRHRAAGRLYRRSGFALLDEKPAVAFGQEMREQLWELAL